MRPSGDLCLSIRTGRFRINSVAGDELCDDNFGGLCENAKLIALVIRKVDECEGKT